MYTPFLISTGVDFLQSLVNDAAKWCDTALANAQNWIFMIFINYINPIVWRDFMLKEVYTVVFKWVKTNIFLIK